MHIVFIFQELFMHCDFDEVFVRKYIEDFCARYEYPKEATEFFLSVYDRVCADKELKEKFFAPVKAYAAGEKFRYGEHLSGYTKKGVSECKLVAEKLGVSTYTADFLYCLCLIPYLEKLYEEKGLDKKIFYDGMIDFKCKLWECKKVYNVWGSFVAGWFGGWFTLGRFQFGRLQYEPCKGIWITCFVGDKKKKLVRLWQKFLNLHIPSMGPLRPEEVEDSFKQAYAFFRKRGYGKNIVYHTSSWLLSPDHRKMFKPDSNIIRFMDCFHVASVHDETDNNDFWRIYDRPFDAKNPDCSGSTTMQREYAKIIMAGGHIKHGSGVFIYDGEKFYK